MTTIAFDGKTVAADRRSTSSSGLIRECCKLERFRGHILTSSGPEAQGIAMQAWFKDGCKPEAFPNKGLNEHDMAWLVVFGPTGIIEFQNTPYPLPIIDKIQAWGSGKGIALGAMLAGAPAELAVRIACEVDCYSGNGVDTMEWIGERSPEAVRRDAPAAGGPDDAALFRARVAQTPRP